LSPGARDPAEVVVINVLSDVGHRSAASTSSPLVYRMRRVDCRGCGVRVEEVPWAIGKHQMTKAFMLFLAYWAKKLSWTETVLAFRCSQDKVCQAVECVVIGARASQPRSDRCHRR
jgi:hypothetical protein